MKKALAIALCVLAVCFASCNKEKPNQQFVGNYHGNVTANLTIAALNTTMPMEPTDMEMTMNITAGAKDDEIVAVCTIQEETRTLNGIVSGNDVDFDPLIINENVEGSQINITIDLNGTLAGTVLNVNGTITGSGTIIYDDFSTPIPVTLTGTASGALNKLVAE